MAMNPMEQFEIKPLAHGWVRHHDLLFTNQSLWMCIVAGVASLFLTLAVANPKLVPGRLQSMAELTYEFVANMIRSVAGEDGLVFFPFVFTLFVFVLFSNFFGLLPGAFTVTSHIAVTFALACMVILIVIFTGFARHGIGFLKLFVPDVPLLLLFLLVPIEVISFLIRPLSLSVRLFANMLAGHTMLKVFAGFVVMLGGAGGVFAALSIAPMFLIVAITALEMLIAFLQAYVFAVLTCIYLNEALHLHEHH
jgi:F-type H+-transporting ATPase subunit a